jgi:molybdopterin-guanine dinucleotide biosynthesis protein A
VTAIAAILAGGRSSRMGQPKPPVLLAGTPLILHPITAARAAGLEPWVIAKEGTPLPPLDCAVVTEPDETFHPLAGIAAALDAAGDRAVVALGADMPFVSERLIAWLASQPMTTVTETSGRIQPLLARYESFDAEALRTAMNAGEPARDAVMALHPKVVNETDLGRFGEPSLLTFNVNTPEDLAEAERIAATRTAA